jgi:hypothetical protein
VHGDKTLLMVYHYPGQSLGVDVSAILTIGIAGHMSQLPIPLFYTSQLSLVVFSQLVTTRQAFTRVRIPWWLLEVNMNVYDVTFLCYLLAWIVIPLIAAVIYKWRK